MKRLGGGVAVRMTAVLLAAVMQATWLAVFAREVGPTDFGVFSIMLSLVLLFGTLAGFGLHNYALRLDYRAVDAPSAIASIVSLRLLTLVAAWIAVAVALGFTDPTLVPVLLLAAGAASLELLSDVAQGVLSGQKRIASAALLLLGQRAIVLIAVGLGLLVGQLWLAMAIGVTAASALVVLVLLWRQTLGRPRFRSTILQTKHYWSASVFANLSQLEAPTVGIVAGATSAGFYGAAARLTGPVNLATNAVLAIVVPELAQANSSGERQRIFRRVRLFAVCFGIVVALLALPASLLAVTVLGKEYEGATPYFFAFIVAAGVSGISRTYQAALYAVDQARPVATAILSGTVAGLASIVVLAQIPMPAAVAAAPIIAQLLILALLIHSYRRRTNVL